MATKKTNKATFKYGGVTLNFTKSKTQGAVRYKPSAKTQPAKRGVAAPPQQIEGFSVMSSKRGIDQKIDALREKPEVAVGTHVWNMEGQEDTPFIPTGNLYIEFSEKSDAEQQQAILEEFGLNIKEVVDTGCFRVSVTPQSPNPVKCAMLLQKKKLVRVAEPEFVTTPAQRDFSAPSGKFIDTQWHLENIGRPIPIIDAPNSNFGSSHFKKGADARVKEAWRYLGSLGSKFIKIAVIDTGFALEHPQLKGDGTKTRNPFNAATRSADVSPWFQDSDGTWEVFSHGTSCAAVAAGAMDNNGILGAAPNARIIPIKLDILSDDAIKKAFEHAMLNGADIISCSLGYPKAVPLSTYITNYLRRVATEGRAGKGIPMFFAAGNANPSSDWRPREISDFAAHPEAICVTASNSLDEPSSYSFFGENALICAPTNGDDGVGITTATCDKNGSKLLLGYTSDFGGTSSATPLAAGVCALMLSANPELTLDDIKDIFKNTSDKIGASDDYDRHGHSATMGYGRINALKAVKMAAQMASGDTDNQQEEEEPAEEPAAPATQRGRVASKTLNVRTGPATSFSKVAQLVQGDIVNLLEKKSNWWRIGTNKWVSGDYIQVLGNAPATKKGQVSNTYVNVRSGPGVGFTKVSELKKGAVVTIYETTTDGWYRVGSGQWVLGKYVQIV